MSALARQLAIARARRTTRSSSRRRVHGSLGDHRDDLLREHVERAVGDADRLDLAVEHPARDHRRLEQVAAELRQDAAALEPPTWWPARPMRCSPRETAPGDSTCTTRSTAPMSMPSSSELRRDDAAQPAGLERLLDLEALIARDRAVVRAHQRLAGELVRARSASRSHKPAAVGEHDRRAVRAHQLEQPRVDRAATCPGARRTAARRRGPPAATPAPAADSPCPRPAPRSSDRAAASRPRRRSRPAAACPRRAAEKARDLRRADAASPTGRCAAARARVSSTSRSSDSARCAPRLVGASAWISSTMTVSTPRRIVARVRRRAAGTATPAS